MEYTPENVAKLEAEIAEKLMGFKYILYAAPPKFGETGWFCKAVKENGWMRVPKYLSDSNAWDTVVDKLLELELDFMIEEIAELPGYSLGISYNDNALSGLDGGETRQEARFHAMTEALPKILEIMQGDQG